MVDLVLGVSDPRRWHAENMRANPGHYAALPRAMGPAAVTALQVLCSGPDGAGNGCYSARVEAEYSVGVVGCASTHAPRRHLTAPPGAPLLHYRSPHLMCNTDDTMTGSVVFSLSSTGPLHDRPRCDWLK